MMLLTACRSACARRPVSPDMMLGCGAYTHRQGVRHDALRQCWARIAHKDWRPHPAVGTCVASAFHTLLSANTWLLLETYDVPHAPQDGPDVSVASCRGPGGLHEVLDTRVGAVEAAEESLWQEGRDVTSCRAEAMAGASG